MVILVVVVGMVKMMEMVKGGDFKSDDDSDGGYVDQKY